MDGYHGQEIAIDDDMFIKFEVTNIESLIKILSGEIGFIKQAKIESKGIVPEFKLFLSNTNAPFLRIEGVADMNTVWRRRHLIKVDKITNPWSVADAGTDNMYLRHMKFTVVDPLDPNFTPLSPELVDLPFDYIRRWTSAVATAHKLKEDARARDYGQLDLRRKYTQYDESLRKAMSDLPASLTLATPYLIKSLYHEPTSRATANMPEVQSRIRIPRAQCQDCELPDMELINYHPTCTVMSLDKLLTHTRAQIAQVGGSPHGLDFSRVEDVNDMISTSMVSTVLSPSAQPSLALCSSEEEERDEAVWGGEPGLLSNHTEHLLDYDRILIEMHQPIRSILPGNSMPIRRFIYNCNGLSPNLCASRYFRMQVAALLLRLYQYPTVSTLYDFYRGSLHGPDEAIFIQSLRERININESRLHKVMRFIARPIHAMAKKLPLILFYGLTGITVVVVLRAIARILVPNMDDAQLLRVAPGQTLSASQIIRREQLIRSLPSPHYGVSERRNIIPLAHNNDELVLASHNDNLSMLSRRGVCRIEFKVAHQSGFRLITGNMFAVKGNNFLLNRHTTSRMPASGNFLVNVTIPVRVRGSEPNTFRIRYDVEEHYVNIKDHLRHFPEYDASILTIPTCRAMIDSVNQFITRRDIERGLMVDEPFFMVDLRKDGLTTTCYPGPSIRGDQTYTDKSCSEVYKNRRAFVFNFEGMVCEHGQSGAIAVSQNRHLQRPFFGIHGGGTDTQGWIVPITQEDIKDILNRVDQMYNITIPDPTVHAHVSVRPCVSNVNIVGGFLENIPKPGSTRFVKTPIQNQAEFPIDTEPAILADSDPRWVKAVQEDPSLPHYASISFQKYEGANPPLEWEDLRELAEEKAQHMVQHFRNVRVQTIEESILGNGHSGSKPMDRTTSPGLPYILRGNKKGKTEWINPLPDGKSVEIHPLLQRDVDDFMQSLENNSFPERYKAVFLKDETLPKSKIFQKTRSIIMGDVADHIVYGMLQGDYDRIQKISDCHDVHVATGIDLESDDTHQLILGFGETHTMYCFDAKNWDGNLPYAIIRAQAYYRARVYELAYRARGELAPFDFVKYFMAYSEGQAIANLVLGPEVTRTRRGMKSGQRDTTSSNSEAHDLIAFKGWRDFCRKNDMQQFMSYATFNRYVKRVYCGDDSGYSVQNPLEKLLTPDVMVSWYRNVGIPVTAADKSANISTCTLEDFQFLKHRFQYSQEHGRYIAVPDLSIIYNLLNWQSTTLSKPEQFGVNVQQALRFAYWHGRTSYEQIMERILRASMRANVIAPHIPYDVMGKWISCDGDLKSIGLESFTISGTGR